MTTERITSILMKKSEKECLIIQHTNNKTGIGQTTGFVDELSIMWSASKVIG